MNVFRLKFKNCHPELVEGLTLMSFQHHNVIPAPQCHTRNTMAFQQYNVIPAIQCHSSNTMSYLRRQVSRKKASYCEIKFIATTSVVIVKVNSYNLCLLMQFFEKYSYIILIDYKLHLVCREFVTMSFWA